MSIFKVKVIQGHEVKERSNWKVWVMAAWYMFLGQFFVKNTKMTLEYFLNYPNRTNFNNRKNAKNGGKQREKMAFFEVQNTKTRPFFRIYAWNSVHIYTWQGYFTYIPFFLKIRKSHHFLKIAFFLLYFSKLSKSSNFVNSR